MTDDDIAQRITELETRLDRAIERIITLEEIADERENENVATDN